MDAGIEEHLAAGRHARAFDLVVPAFRDRVFRLAYSILKDRAAAEDAAQETFVRVWKALPGFDGRAQLGEINPLHREQVEQAGFAVLKAPDIPSILVETAFISNPDEEKKLKSGAYQDRMAAAIYQGIKRYFAKNPPLARTRLAGTE